MANSFADFNSSMVRLKVGHLRLPCVHNEFQFLNGSIKRKGNILLSFANRHFNSSMVRLKVFKRTGTGLIFLNFNSSMVRLKGFAAFLHALFWGYFNSSMVRLKDLIPLLFHNNQRHFNSSMVRLKGLDNVLSRRIKTFQFLNGSIKSTLSHTLTRRLFISIPQWFD